jgi:hypothetical protein
MIDGNKLWYVSTEEGCPLRGISDGWARVANLFSQLSHIPLRRL